MPNHLRAAAIGTVLATVGVVAPACTIPGNLADYGVDTLHVDADSQGERLVLTVTLAQAAGDDCAALEDDVRARGNGATLSATSSGGTDPVRPSNGNLSCGAAQFQGDARPADEIAVGVSDDSAQVAARFAAAPTILERGAVEGVAGEAVIVGMLPEDVVEATVTWDVGAYGALPTSSSELGSERPLLLDIPTADVVAPGRHLLVLDLYREPGATTCDGARACVLRLAEHRELIVDVLAPEADDGG